MIAVSYDDASLCGIVSKLTHGAILSLQLVQTCNRFSNNSHCHLKKKLFETRWRLLMKCIIIGIINYLRQLTILTYCQSKLGEQISKFQCHWNQHRKFACSSLSPYPLIFRLYTCLFYASPLLFKYIMHVDVLHNWHAHISCTHIFIYMSL